ncbi:uncharacterized protein FIBRA_07340 [Fibroporia radiculosa]|uniref:NAD(P)-binding domain-containing protein n=1 Tax=Fibroporia radiculosa TaxID=599839 RepID=J4I0I6_9APHY|nr:uncharacterized protein FIBRA_07340 [Fibroporia radiculosa]CCM05132.1 predicted protein [Fibroporia radiculosa]
MNVFAIGASRNIGYYASVRLLEKGATVTFLLRSLSVFNEDKVIQKFVEAGTARLVKGDALNPDDVRKGWEASQSAFPDGHVNLVLFTVGGTPSFSLTRGAVINPPNLCTKCLLTVLSTMPASLREPAAQPRLVVVTSNGLTRSTHAALPILLKPMYGYLLDGPHADKLATERVLAHCAGRAWTDEEPREGFLSADWQKQEGLPHPGELKHFAVIRPALLTDGASKAESAQRPPYRVEEGMLKQAYRVSRKDVAHFLVESLLPDWTQWEGKFVCIAY